MALYQDWDGVLVAGSLARASSSNDKVWGEECLAATDLPYGTAVAWNAAGGVKKFAAVGDTFHGIVVKDIYGGGVAPNDRIANVAHISHGDGIRVATVSGQTFTRGGKAFIVASGANAGLFTATSAATTIDVGFIVEKVGSGTNGVIEVTLGYNQVAGA